MQRAFRRWVQYGPLGQQHLALTPNPSLTVPSTYISPRKKRESGLGSPSTSFTLGGTMPGAPSMLSPGALAASALARRDDADGFVTPAPPAGTATASIATKRLKLDDEFDSTDLL